MAANFAYKNTRDLEFILEEWLPIEDIFACEKYSAYTKEEIKPLLNTARKMAKEAMEPAYDDADQNPAQLVDGKVIVPPSYQALWDMIQANGWGNSNMDPDPEAVTLPETLYSACREMFQAANCDFQMYFALSAKVTDIIARFGSERTKKIFLPNLLAGKWSGGMGLTEPSAGSDVGDLLSRAYPTDDPDIYKLKGQKIFISCAGHPLTENNIILCLARVEGALPGSPGVSLFMLPEIWVNEDGTMEPNDFEITAVEHKMGLHGQPTCAFSYGDNNGCRAWRMGVDPLQNGGRGDGMRIIFNLVNSSRLGNGLWSTALSANATYNARDYAAERIQGYNGKGERVAVIEHADTRRKLLNGKAIAEAGRALVYKGNYYVDISKHHPDAAVRKEAADSLAILVPLAKAYCTDEVWNVAADAIQIYGGYGYCEDYPVAHIARDCKITSILEGTNYIQAWDLISRKMTMGNGVPFQKALDEIAVFIVSNKTSAVFAREFAVMDEACKAYRVIAAKVKEWQADLEKYQDTLSFYACKILTATAQLFAGRLLLDQALLAAQKAEAIGRDHFDYHFYNGKIVATRYYVKNIVPAVVSTAGMIENSDSTEVDFDNAIFDY